MTTDRFDIAVIGSGFAGSLMAMIATRLGRSVILIEKGAHPRFAIGESSTPLANLILEQLAQRYNLPRLLPLTKWGSWQQTYPELACGLKRGFSFFHHCWNEPFQKQADHSNELLVAASPNARIADTHWFRQDFDAFLLQEAQTLGVTYLDRTTISAVDIESEQKILRLNREGVSQRINARLILDASGPRGLLHRLLKLEEASFPGMPRTQALFSHFSQVPRLDTLREFNDPTPPPFPVDDAAVHHVFPGGWVWVLRFNNGITSAGVAACDALASELRFAEGRPAWDRLLARLPELKSLFGPSRPEQPFVHLGQLPFRTNRATGNGWALLPSAAGFVDPLLSTGFPLTLLGIERLARVLENWRGDSSDSPFSKALKAYEITTFSELDSAAMLVGALYAVMDDFPLFSKLSLLYFGAASYSETCRRLNRGSADRKFLLGDNALFSEQLRSCCLKAMARVPSEREELLLEIDRAIEPIDIAGLTKSNMRHWYPVDSTDLLRAALKLHATEAEIRELLVRCEFE